MGDLVEITTVPHQPLIFYRVTSGALSFYVRGPGYAGIGLAKKPGNLCDILIGLGCSGGTWISRKNNCVVRIRTPNVISPREFKGFWIQWHNDVISLGREHDREALITYNYKTFNLRYISFNVISEYGAQPLQWKFEIPPLREKQKIKPVSKGKPQWIHADSMLPDGALIGGLENETLYIIRAGHRGSLTPGKFVPSEGVGYIPWGGGMHEKSEFEVLCGYDCIWIPASNGALPLGAVEAGHSEASGNERLYVGRALYHDHLIPGKVQPSHKVCYIPYDDKEIAMKHYEVLVEPLKNVQCLHASFMHDLYLNQTSEEEDNDEIEED